jgi:hypothetical protein
VQDPLGADPGSLGYLLHRCDRAFEEEEHDLVIGDPQRAEIANGIPPPRQLGHGARDPAVEIAKLVLAYAGPETLRDPLGAARPGHAANLGRRERCTNQGFPYV